MFENNLEFLCGMYDVLKEKIDKELTRIAKINPVNVSCDKAIDSDYFLTYMGVDVVVYGIRSEKSDVYIDVIYVNGVNAHTCSALPLNKFNFEDKEKIAVYIDDMIKNEKPSRSLEQIMDYNNGHSKNLVDKINWIANDPVRKTLFDNVLSFLGSVYSDEYDYNEDDKWGFLTNVCDDTDLETIITHCRIETFLPNDNERFKNCDELVKHYSKPFPTNN